VERVRISLLVLMHCSLIGCGKESGLPTLVNVTEIHVKKLPKTDNSLLLRTDFSDDGAWAALCDSVQEPSKEGFQARLHCISDRVYDGLTVEQLVALALKGGNHSFAFIADWTTFTNPERLVLVVDLYDELGRTFRVIPIEMWSVENNLSVANMDFYEFADSVDADGVFCGFPQP
jgi:hypothetical protein